MWRPLFLWIALLAASALVALLAWQNRGLRAQRDWLSDRVDYAYPGMYVPRIDVRSIDGAAIELGAPSAEHQVLFFFTHTCPYCLQSAPTVAEAARRLRRSFGDRVAMLGICQCSADQAREYAERHDFDFPVVAMSDRRSLTLYRARMVPVLMIVGRDGRIVHAAQGVFATRRQIDALFASLQKPTSP
jgi:peroxiredoxin